VAALSIPKLANQIKTEADAYEFLERMRWGDGVVCPHCDHDKAYFLKAQNGGRQTRTGTISERRVWKCASCRKQFSALTGTIFHGSKIPVRTWLFVVFEMCSSKNGVSAREIERKYGLHPKSAWFMTHRIREAMKRDPLAGLLRGAIVADESYIGGKPKLPNGTLKPQTGKRLRKDKPAVVSLINTSTGEVRSRVVPWVDGHKLREVLRDEVDIPNSTLQTDEAGHYKAIGREFQSHDAVWHSGGEYVRYEGGRTITSNQAENFFSQLKRSIDGTHHRVSREHLQRYLAEFDFRYSTRKTTDTGRMETLMRQVGGKRLTYRPLTGR
jgi:transposase-like protein